MKTTPGTNRTLFLVAGVILLGRTTGQAEPRKVIRLDGTWQIAEGLMEAIPKQFEHEVPVPGLVDLAKPAFAEVGLKSARRQAFWYRRTFKLEATIPDVAILKINKAKYGTEVFLNGQRVGEHLPCFTPALMNVKRFLKDKGRDNELIIRVGAGRESVPEGQPAGWDFEKYKYIPGIYDSVDLILTGSPHIANIQTVPNVPAGTVRVITELQAPASSGSASPVSYEIREAKSGQIVGAAEVPDAALKAGQTTKVDLVIPIDNCRLWSPEDPFLYRLTVTTEADRLSTRFGMRSFQFDPQSKRAILNGKGYYMRGTNVCVYRFFEDDARGDKPWRREWVRRLHRKFKGMHWNSIRYCIGFPPEIWYEVADEEGFLIQDEFPIWLLGKAPEKPVAEKILPEYTEWMRTRWNHPCVVIWDGQNESVTVETGKAIQAVRHLDLSNRPWENGWSPPQNATDFVEAHPYLFIKGWHGKESFRFKDIANVSGVPYLREAQKKLNVPILVNEYGWLWLTRDGHPTCLTNKVYESLLGPDSTVQQRRVLYAKYLAALTEFWRGHRQCAGVLHFCGLGYSRPGDVPRPEGGATSDHFIDLEKLQFEPHFAEYVRDAFSPLGLMIDFWDEQLSGGQRKQVKVYVVNDLQDSRGGQLELRIVEGHGNVSQNYQNDRHFSGTTPPEVGLVSTSKTLVRQSRPFRVAGLGREILTFDLGIPKEPGSYQLIGRLSPENGKPVRSLREFRVVGQRN